MAEDPVLFMLTLEGGNRSLLPGFVPTRHSETTKINKILNTLSLVTLFKQENYTHA